MNCDYVVTQIGAQTKRIVEDVNNVEIFSGFLVYVSFYMTGNYLFLVFGFYAVTVYICANFLCGPFI